MQAEAKLRIGYSRKAVLLELGETPERADELLAERAVEDAQQADMDGQLFDRGIV
jgi:hypothetical protein